MTKKELKLIGEIQTLVGTAKNAYQDDRNPNRAEKVTAALDKAFELCLQLTAKYPPV